jgi:hypothetical protein
MSLEYPIVEGRANNIHSVLDANDRLGYSGIDY